MKKLGQRSHALTFGLVCVLAAAAVLPNLVGTGAARAGGTSSGERETEHLHLFWIDGVSQEAVNLVETQGEEFYKGIADLLGTEPPRKVRILLQGPAEGPDYKQRGYPHVDSFGQVHLYRYGGQDSSYVSALAHELVHVFRYDRRRTADWFFEEGFAELVALTLDPSLRGFPWYDTPLVIATGQWLDSGESLSLGRLQKDHRALNLPCKAQAYTLRSSFFRFLADTRGLDRVLDMAKEETAGKLEQYETYFGQPLAALESEWQKATLREYHAIPDRKAQADRYRTQTPIQYMDVCP